MAAEEQNVVFGVEQQRFYYHWSGEQFTRDEFTVDPDSIDGFETSQLSKDAVAIIIAQTFSSMKENGASALGLDIDSMFGRVHASGHIDAALDVGKRVLDELAERTDDVTWEGWLKQQFPIAMAVMYGEESDPVKLSAELLTSES